MHYVDYFIADRIFTVECAARLVQIGLLDHPADHVPHKSQHRLLQIIRWKTNVHLATSLVYLHKMFHFPIL